MGDTAKLIERLRTRRIPFGIHNELLPDDVSIEAADALTALREEVERLTKALDLGKAIEAAALTWCGQKDRETFMSDIEYFRQNWSALPGLCAYVDRELGRAARALRSPSVEPGNG